MRLRRKGSEVRKLRTRNGRELFGCEGPRADTEFAPLLWSQRPENSPLHPVTTHTCLLLAPTEDPEVFRAPDGRLLSPPPGWQRLPPGDAGLTRRVKAAGPSWSVVETRGRKKFSQGLWAPSDNIAAARSALLVERASPAYVKKRTADVQRREREQAQYVLTFEQHVLTFLRFSTRYAALARSLAAKVTAHATPVGSGTVARTERISVERRAEAAIIAWMRHQTTAYDNLPIARVKGERRRVRRELAEVSRAVLDLHRRDATHAVEVCPLCKALGAAEATSRLGSGAARL